MKSHRPVDVAMNKNRSAKQSIRNLWVEEVKAVAEKYPDASVPYYLTLSGAEGRDIELLISEGLISLTETGGISEKDQTKIVAIERSSLAIADLQRKFVGLWIKQVDFRGLIRGEGPFAWPEGEDIDVCRALVVNLDLNEALSARREDNQKIIFPVLEWITKLCHIHAKYPQTDWTLCLTLHGAINWPKDINKWVKAFLVENFEREPLFSQKCSEFFGTELFERIRTVSDELEGLNSDDQQKIIMAIVPKIINKLVCSDGWGVRTEYNLRYGGDGAAPMVAWIVRFIWDESGSASSDAMYKASLRGIFDGLGSVLDTGEIENQN